MAELIGQFVRGRYRVQELIRQFSALGGLYRAEDLALNRTVAIRIHDLIEGHPVGARLIKHEATVLAQLQHPGIQQVYDVGEHEGRYWYAAELFDAGSLEDAIRSGSVDRELALSVLIRVAETIGYVHRRGFIHRNLHPGNLRFDLHGQPRVTGFGSATTREDAATGNAPSALGKLVFMAPELIAPEGKEVGPEADVWSLGAVLLSCLTGLDSLEQGVRRLVNERSVNDSERIDEVVKETIHGLPAVAQSGCEEIVSRCLEAKPAARYPDAEAVAEALQELGRAARSRRGPRVFVSHSTLDRSFVEREVVAPLERSGIPTWYAKADINSAEHWERTIVHGLESSEWFILVMSPNSASSDWVRDEVNWAVTHRPDRILPVLAEECDPWEFHIRIPRLQRIDLVEDLARGQELLIDRLSDGGAQSG